MYNVHIVWYMLTTLAFRLHIRSLYIKQMTNEILHIACVASGVGHCNIWGAVQYIINVNNSEWICFPNLGFYWGM